jgi:hypothetical protein
MPGVASEEILGRRALNRALLDRQLLLRRAERPVSDTVEHLIGLQAQSIAPPYCGLWSRLEGFDPHELGRLLTDREAVRMTLMRGTVHLVTVRDALLLRPLVQVVIERSHNGAFGRRMGGADIGELGRRLVARGIGDDVEAMGNAVRAHVPLVQVPPRGVWGKSGQAKYATLESWTGGELERNPSVDEVVVRYLSAFGSGSSASTTTCCWATPTAPGSSLRTFRGRRCWPPAAS